MTCNIEMSNSQDSVLGGGKKGKREGETALGGKKNQSVEKLLLWVCVSSAFIIPCFCVKTSESLQRVSAACLPDSQLLPLGATGVSPDTEAVISYRKARRFKPGPDR